MARPFQTLDVFTETALAGNPLAMVFDAEGLDDVRMQAIAAEFNLSETVFVFEPRNAVNSARVRIFTPKRELPFAGHPTVGAAALIAHRARRRSAPRPGSPDRAGGADRRRGLRRAPTQGPGARRLFRAAEAARTAPCRAAVASAKSPQALGLSPRTSASRRMSPASIARARPFCSFRSARSTRSAAPRPERCPGRPGMVRRRSSTPARRRAKDPPITRACSRARGGWPKIRRPAARPPHSPASSRTFDRPRDGEHMLVIEQGFEMGRPSLIALGLVIEAGALASATIGGSVVLIANGSLDL